MQSKIFFSNKVIPDWGGNTSGIIHRNPAINPYTFLAKICIKITGNLGLHTVDCDACLRPLHMGWENAIFYRIFSASVLTWCSPMCSCTQRSSEAYRGNVFRGRKNAPEVHFFYRALGIFLPIRSFTGVDNHMWQYAVYGPSGQDRFL